MAKRHSRKIGARDHVQAAEKQAALPAWKSWLPKVLLIVAVTLWIYWPSLEGGFVWDDVWYITTNTLLRDTSGLWKLWFEPGSWTEYYPLEETVQWLQWHCWGDEPLGYHLTNVALHVLNAILVWRLLDKFGLRFAWLGGLIFAVHPAQVESVAWMVELKNTLSLPFFLLAMCSWIDYEERHKESDYWRALGLFLIAMLCKITMTAFPFVILLYAWWRRGRIGWGDLKASAPFFAVSLILGYLTVWADHRYDEMGHNPAEAIFLDGFSSQVLVAGHVLTFYFSRAFVPIDYLPAYPKWQPDAFSPWSYLPWLVLAGAAYGMWTARKTWGRHALLGVGFFVLLLTPFLGFLPLKYMSFTWVMDHFLYIPMIGLIGLGVAALGDLETRFLPNRSYVTGAITIAIALMALESHIFANLFINDETLWTYALDRDPTSWLAQNNVGADLARRGEYERALGHYREVLRLNPGYSDGHYNLAEALDKMGDPAGAQEEYREALKLNPGDGKLYLGLAQSLVRSGNRAAALEQFEQAIKSFPDFAPLRYNLGSILLQSGKLPEAIEQLQVAVKLDPSLAQAHENLGTALAQSGHLPGAIAQFEAAVRIELSYLIARDNLALALAQSGRIPEATDQFQQVLLIDPNNAAARDGLAQLQRAQAGVPVSH